MSDLIGKTLGKYQIIVRLGRGGMARVYKAYQPGLDRYVAVKVLHHYLAEESGFVNRFEREATAVARLRHPNIVQVYDYDREDQMYYMVMEYVEGPTLKAEMEERHQGNGTQGNSEELRGTQNGDAQEFTLEEIAAIFTPLAEAIDYAHSRGMIHRDLKPANIMFTPSGEVMLTDFGLSRMMGGTRYTQTGSISGTPAYMAPEQCQGEQGDERSDIYSLGVILYEMITGRVPFDADTPYALMLKHITEAATAPSSYKPALPPAVEQIICKALAKQPAERYQTAGEMAAALRQAVGLTAGPRPQATFAPIAGIPLLHESTPTPGRDGAEHLPSTARLAVSSPYRGLYAFREEDATFFFGRETFTDRLRHTIQEKNMAAVIGPSGSGKSSVIYAGLIPHLRQDGHWTIVEMRPGSRPYHALAAALIPFLEPELSETSQLVEAQKLAEALRQGQVALLDVAQRIVQKQPERGRLLLFIDQFEELYTLCPDPAVRGTFPNYLFQAIEKNDGAVESTAPSSLCLVLTLRADFMGQALTDRPFADALQDADVKLGPMTRAELARAIESPAGKQGVIFETGLAERILDDVGNEPGNLPLLEFALTLLWDRRSGRRLTHAAYEAIGRVEGSLARYADEVYEALSDADKERARRVFTQMVRPGEGTEDTRRLATRSELGENDWALAQRLADARLVVTGLGFDPDGEETAEVVHEALIRGWGQLRQWMGNDRAFRSWQERLRSAIRQWESTERDEGALLRGAPLSEAEDWMNRQDHDLTQMEREFVKTSISLREQRAAEREAQRQRELAAARQLAEEQKRRADEQAASSRRLRALTSVLAVVFVIAVFAALFALGQRQDAVAAQQAAEQEADARATEVQVRSTAEAQAEQNASLAVTREAEARNAQATAEAERLRADDQAEQALAAQEEAEVERDRADAEARLALSRQLAVQSGTFLNAQLDLGLLTAVQANAISDTVETRSSILTALQFNPQLYTYLRGHSSLVQGIAFSPDSAMIASVGANGEVHLWEVASRQLMPQTFTGHDTTQLVNSVAFSPDGRTLATVSDDLTTILWDVATGEIIHQLAGHTEFVQDIAYSPDGTLIATGAGDNTVRLWNAASGQEVAVLVGHTNQVWSVAFSPDSQLLASGDADSIVRLWNLVTRQTIGEFSLAPADAPPGAIYNLAFSPDGQILAVTDPNLLTVRLWDVATQQELDQSLTGHAGFVLGLAFSPDGGQVATSSGDSTVRLWDISDLVAGETAQAPVGLIWNHHQTTTPALAYSPNGQFVATGEGNGTIIVWDVGARHWLTDELAPARDKGVSTVAYDPTGQLLASAESDGRTLLWDLTTNPVTSRTLTHTADVNLALTGLVFDPSGQYLTAGRANGNLAAWEVSSGQVITSLVSHLQGELAVALSPDGQLFASGTINGNIILRSGDSLVGAGGFLSGHGGPINALAFSPDSRIVASASEDGTVRLWDANTNDPFQDPLPHNNTPVEALAFAPANNWLASADRSGTIRLWDWTAGQPVSQPLQLHNQPVLTLRFSDDGQRLYSADATGVIVEWDITGGIALEGLVEVGPNVTRLLFTPNGEQLIAGYEDGSVTVWEVATNQAIATFSGHTTAVSSLALTPDGRTLAAGDETGHALVWNLSNGEAVTGTLTAEPATLNVFDLSFSGDGRYLATAANDSSVLIWDVASGTPIGPPIFTGYAGIFDLELSPDGQTLALGSCAHYEVRLGCNQGRIYFWDVASGEFKATMEAHVNAIGAITFSPDGRWLVSGGCANADIAGTCIRGGVYRWDLSANPPTGELLREFGFPIGQLLFSPNGSLLMVAGGNTITLLDANTGEPIGQRLSGHTGGLTSTTFSPDGRYLASSSCGGFAPVIGCILGEIILWDVASGQPIGVPLLGHTKAATSVAFSPDGQTLASGAGDASLILWDINPDHWRAHVCRVANRDFTPAEWQRFFGDEPYRPVCP